MNQTLRRAALISAVIVVGLIGTLQLCINLRAVQQFTIARVNVALRGTVTLGQLHLSLLAMQLEIRDVALADSSGKKLAGFDRLLIGISPLGLLRGTLVVEKAVLEHPWVVFDVDSSGHLSLLDVLPKSQVTPQDSVAAAKSTTSKPLAIEVRSLNIIGGRFLFAGPQDSLRGQAYGLSVAASGTTASITADVRLAMDSVALHRTGANLHVRDVFLMARVRNMDIDTVNLRLRTDHSTFSLNGRASALTSSPFVNIAVDADLALSEIRSVLELGQPLSGSAKLRMQLFGTVANPDLDLDVTYGGGTVGGYPVESMVLKAHLTDRVLKVMPLHVDIARGSFDASSQIDLRGMFPGGLLAAPGHPDSLRATLALSARVAALQLDAKSLPLKATASCSVTVAHGTAQAHRLTGQLGTTNASLRGTYGISSGAIDAALAITAPMLGQLLGFAGIDSASGNARVAARFKGDLKHPEAELELDADAVRLGAMRIGSIECAAALARSGMARVTRLALTNGSSNMKLAGSAHVLDKGRPLPVDMMTFDLSLVSHALIQDFVDSISGTADVDIALKGTAVDPRGHVVVTVTDFSAVGQKVAQIGLDARLENRRVRIEPLRITLKRGQEVTATGWMSLKDTFDLSLSTSGIRLNALAFLAGAKSLDGEVSMALLAGGTYATPEAQGNLLVAGIRMGAVALDDIRLQLDLHHQQVAVKGTLGGDIAAGYNLDTRAFLANISFDSLSLAPYLALSGQNLTGTLTAALKASGNADSIAGIAATLHIADLVIGSMDTQIIETHGLSAVLDNGRYAVPDFSIVLADGGLLTGSAQGQLSGPHNAHLSGHVSLASARPFSADLADIEGSVTLDASLRGTAASPELRADVQLKNIAMAVPGLSQRLHSLNGHILADQKSVRIETLQGNLDEGVFSMHGELELDKLAASDVRAEITLKSVPLGVPDMLDMVLDGKLRIAGTPDTTLVSGDIVLLDGLYYKDVVINPLAGFGQRTRKEPAPPGEHTTPYLRNMRFDIGVQARSTFRVDNNVAQLTVAPDLQLMGSLQSPALNGQARVEQGTITYNKKVFTVDKGIVDFVNPYAIEPRIDIQGTVAVRDWVIRILLSGTPDDLSLKLVSDDPGLADQDLLSLLVAGKTIAELQSSLTSGGGGGQSNQQMLASLVASTFGEDARKASGLDMLQLETGDERNQNSDRIAVTLGKQLTKRLATKYAIESEEGTIVQKASAEYRIVQNLLIAGFQNTRGVYGGEVRLIGQWR